MTETIDPKFFGLPSATCIEKQGKGAYAIVIRRKSRIIMKDGQNILAKAEKIRSEYPGIKVSVLTTAPVCSKTRAFLAENGIPIDTVNSHC